MSGSGYGEWTVQKLKMELSKRNVAVSGRKKDLVDRTAVDKSSISDLKSIEKGKSLYDSGRVDACIVHITHTDINFTGIVRAAMKKSISYNYKLRIDDRTAEVINSDCECPAGKGPHATCKHIAAVMLLLKDFSESGTVNVAKPATEILQSFHRPSKAHLGSPVKAEDLPSSIKPSMDDPRPEKYRKMEGYTDRVRSMVLNYCGTTSKDITMRYMYKRADIQTATLDHDYLQLPFTDYWVDWSFQVAERDIMEVEEATRNRANSKSWYKEREWRINASRFGDICSATDKRNMDKLCQSLTSNKKLSGPAIIHGLQYEHAALRKFKKVKDVKVKKCGLFIDVSRSYLGATPDGIIDEQSIIEVKCPYNGMDEEHIVPGKNFPFLEYADEGSIHLRKHDKCYDQIQGQLYITKRRLLFCCFHI